MIARTIATAALLLTLGTPAFAQLQITIDATADTITVTGNDTATLDPEFSFGPPTGAYEGTAWWLFGTGAGPFETINTSNSTIQSALVGFNGTTPNNPDNPRLFVYESNGLFLTTFIHDTNSALAEFGGSGVPFSYAGLLTPAVEDYLESLDGQVMAPFASSGASGHSPISITVIPEPASLALLGLGGLLITRRSPR